MFGLLYQILNTPGGDGVGRFEWKVEYGYLWKDGRKERDVSTLGGRWMGRTSQKCVEGPHLVLSVRAYVTEFSRGRSFQRLATTWRVFRCETTSARNIANVLTFHHSLPPSNTMLDVPQNYHYGLN